MLVSEVMEFSKSPFSGTKSLFYLPPFLIGTYPLIEYGRKEKIVKIYPNIPDKGFLTEFPITRYLTIFKSKEISTDISVYASTPLDFSIFYCSRR